MKTKDTIVENVWIPQLTVSELKSGDHYWFEKDKEFASATIIIHEPIEEKKVTISESEFVEIWKRLSQSHGALGSHFLLLYKEIFGKEYEP